VKAFFHVQHLLGIGHLKRAATLAGALAREGFEVTLASGGMPVENIVPPQVRLLQLPPASAEDASFRHLVDDSGRRVDEAWREKRKSILLESYASCAPDVLLVELFPFGRRQLGFELAPLLERVAGRALVGYLSPPGRQAEFFGLWGLAVKFSSILGPLTYGAVTWLTGGDHRLAILITGAYFVAGIAIVAGVDAARGRAAARAAVGADGAAL